MKISDVIAHARDRNYLDQIDRDYLRVKETGEVFTPLSVITKKLNELEAYDPLLFKDKSKTFLEPSCGDGNFLSEVLIRKLQSLGKEEFTDTEFEQVLSTLYGVDLMQDNVDLCRERLLCGSRNPKHIAIVEQNIYQANALKFSYKFEPMSDTRRKREQLHRRRAEKAKRTAEKIKKEQEFKDRVNKLFGLAEVNVKSKKSSNIKEIV